MLHFIVEVFAAKYIFISMNGRFIVLKKRCAKIAILSALTILLGSSQIKAMDIHSVIRYEDTEHVKQFITKNQTSDLATFL